MNVPTPAHKLKDIQYAVIYLGKRYKFQNEAIRQLKFKDLQGHEMYSFNEIAHRFKELNPKEEACVFPSRENDCQPMTKRGFYKVCNNYRRLEQNEII